MYRLRLKFPLWAGVIGLIAPAGALGAGGGGEAVVIVADTRRLAGWEVWWGSLYNESMMYFTVATVITIPVVGVILGTLTDFAMARIGINLKSRAVAEH